MKFEKFVFISIILLVLVAGCSSSKTSVENGSTTTEDDQTTQTTQPQDEVKAPEPPEKTESTANLGDTVNVDDLSYKVTKAETFKEMGSSFLEETTDGKFVKVYVEIMNNSNESKNMFSNRLKIVDGQGRKFDPFPGAALYIADGISFGEQLQPGLTLKGAEVFELPEDASNLKLEISGDWLSTSKITVTLGTITDIGKDTTKQEESEEQLEDIYNQCIPPFECTSSCDELFSQGQKDCPEGQVCCLQT